MLSPASLRVCCLAVMAPALTKADRRAECLPVSLSDPFCESKTDTLYNRKDKHIEANFPKLSSKFACLLKNRQKAYIHKTWYRTHLKNNSPEFCCRSPPADLHNGKCNAESQNEAWHGTSVTLAVADKVRLKYTMNKNINSLRNMGLTRTNASLSLQSMKKVNRLNQLSPKDVGNPSTPDIGESSPDLPDSTISERENDLSIVQSVQLPTSQSLLEDVSSLSRDIDLVRTSLTCSEVDVTLPVTCASPAAEAVSDNSSIILPCNDAKSVSLSQEINSSNSVMLTDLECSTLEPRSTAEDAAFHPNTNLSLNSSQESSILTTSCNIDTSTVESPNVITSSKPVDSSSTISEKSLGCFGLFENEDYISASCPSTMGVRDPSSLSKFNFHDAVKPKLRLPKVPKKKDCCLNSFDSEIFYEQYGDKIKWVAAAVEKAELQFRLWANAHSHKEIGELVHTFQTNLGIPCQRPLKRSPKLMRDMVELKAELLQSEDVKSLSTSALVDLVRKLESSGSPGNLLPTQNVSFSGVEASSSEAAVLAFAPEDVADVIQASRLLLANMQNELKCADPELTESSEDGDSDLEGQEEESAHKMALWKFMKERAALTCRSTWLIARIHELENQLRTAVGTLQKVSSSIGTVCFEEDFAISENSPALITAGSGDAQIKQKIKGLTGPVNGYLDHSSVSSIAHIGQSSCSESLQAQSEVISDVSRTLPMCSRTRALNRSSFQKRDVLVTTGLHLSNSKLLKYSNLNCHCSNQMGVLPCVLCMGRYNCVQTIDSESMPLLDRVALLDPSFHPLLSFQKDIPLSLHFENNFKKNESHYQIVRPVSPTLSQKSVDLGTNSNKLSDVRSRNSNLNRYARKFFSAKYRNKHMRNTKHLRKHGLVFGKWRRYQQRSSFHARDHIRRISIDSSVSSHESPHSPSSIFDEGDNFRRRRDDNQFDINDVIIPYSNKSARLVDFEFKDIVVPSFRIEQTTNENFIYKCSGQDALSKEFIPIQENTLEEAYLARHDPLEIEEKKVNRRPDVTNLGPNPKRLRRDHRFDSRADSSGANTPDPIPFSDQDMFQDFNSMTAPTPPAFSPPQTPSSVNPGSDDSQPSLGMSLATRFDRKKLSNVKRPSEESTRQISESNEEVTPYDLRTFPLAEETYEEIALEPYAEDPELTVSGPSSPASPGSTTQSTSTIEDDITDPEWMVLRNNQQSHELGLKLKLAKR